MPLAAVLHPDPLGGYIALPQTAYPLWGWGEGGKGKDREGNTKKKEMEYRGEDGIDVKNVQIKIKKR